MINQRLFLFIAMSIFCSLKGIASSDKYRIILIDNPSTTITIAWNQISGDAPSVHYDVVDHGTNVNAYANTKGVDRSVYYRGMSNQFARLTGLAPNTNYYFVIADNDGVSQRFWFRTAPDDKSRLSFIAGGDSRNNQTVRRDGNTLVAKLKPHAVLFGGDMTNADIDSEWQEWFDDWQYTTASDGRMIPIVPTRGNHESPETIYKLFDVPSEETYFAMTFGDNMVRTYVLNTNISVTGNQLSWLNNDLNANSAPNVAPRWKIVQYHKPMRPHTTGKSEGNGHYNAWAQLFYDKKVRLVIDCDSHVSKTTWPIRPSSLPGNDEGFVQDDDDGTVYTGEGSWGAPLRPSDDDKSWTRRSGSFNQFKLLFVGKDVIELRTIKIENVANVSEVSNTNSFIIPAGLVVWEPPTGAVVEILQPGGTNCPGKGTACNDGNPDTFADMEDGNCNCKGISQNGTLAYQVADGSDDAEQAESGGLVSISSSDLELAYDASNGQNSQTVGIRFQDVHLPAGANITNAYIQFTVDEKESSACSLIIKGENSGNPFPFENNSFNITNRMTTSASTKWYNIPPWNTIGEQGVSQRTPNLSAIIEEILQNQDWKPLHPMAFIFSGNGTRIAESFDGNNSLAPKLIIEYSLGASIQLPNLSVNNQYGVSYDATSGESYSISCNVFNSGQVAASPCQLAVYLSTNNNPDILIGTKAISSLATNASYLETINVTVPANTTSGAYKYVFVIDDLNSVSESNEGDNWAVSPVTVTSNSTNSCSAIAGFEKLGEYNGHGYYISDDSKPWSQAKIDAENAGGYLATMNNQAENDFLKSLLGNNMVFIGYNDATQEGVGRWATPEPVTLDLSYNNSDKNDFAVMNFWAGTWRMANQWVSKSFIMEIDCGASVELPNLEVDGLSVTYDAVAGGTYNVSCSILNSSQAAAPSCHLAVYLSTNNNPDILIGTKAISSLATNESYTETVNVTVPANTTAGAYKYVFVIDYLSEVMESDEGDNWDVSSVTVANSSSSCGVLVGFTKLGEYNGHGYYISDDSKPWSQAKIDAENAGGYLATMNNQAENDFLKDLLGNNMVFIGYSDAAQEGVGQWATPEPVTLDLNYNNSDENDFAVMNFWAGTWQMVNERVYKKYIMEVNCNDNQPQPIPINPFTQTIGTVQSVYPMPATDNLTLRLESQTEGTKTIYVFDVYGKKWISQSQFISKGFSEIELNVNILPLGTYYLRLGDISQKTMFVIVK